MQLYRNTWNVYRSLDCGRDAWGALRKPGDFGYDDWKTAVIRDVKFKSSAGEVLHLEFEGEGVNVKTISVEKKQNGIHKVPGVIEAEDYKAYNSDVRYIVDPQFPEDVDFLHVWHDGDSAEYELEYIQPMRYDIKFFVANIWL